MKESTYGWYPSVQDIYRPKGRPSSYHLECLYKYNNSMYYQDKALPPKPVLFVRGVSSVPPPPTPEDLRRRSQSVPVPKFKPIPKLHIPTPADCWGHKRLEETKWGIVEEETAPSPSPPSEVSWPIPKDKQQQLFKEHLKKQYISGARSALSSAAGPTAVGVAQSTSRSESTSSQLKWPTASNTELARPQTSSSSGQRSMSAKTSQSNDKYVTSPAPPSGKMTASCRRSARIQSATVHRTKTALPVRPVTAGPSRQSVHDSKPEPAGSLRQRVQRAETEPVQQVTQETVASVCPTSAYEDVSPPTNPFIYDVNDFCAQEDCKEGKITPEVSEDDNYESIVEKYGWRAQIHGDPYKLKKPMKRISYAVNCPEPKLLPDPPNVHMESKETFFYNTIPKRPLSFVVSKEWMSEVLLAKRLELQKRDGGIKYNYKNFAFVY
ncbi:proteoglycan 4-like isoform X2 [Biomphalaria pfeifferi]|uniref:Proteoglycan 4-like isoform X2 n=1 Tax=Biomphalaria pfeifferi TaxID=112525 RepID=A0AAD8EZZ9_BIOPF|nr:proteoglycan 4-like isoform X2 [Biomphalaria pfeifferi]